MAPSPTELQNDPPAADATATQHLSNLPKMSPTAGVGTQEYVAINVAAVIGLLLGLSSILALINDILIVIPLAAAITTAMALRQIAKSNGTQTGSAIAMAGLFLAVSIGSFVAATDTIDWAGRREDRQAIDKLCGDFGQDLHDRTFDAAYDLFSERFKSVHSRQAFVTRLKSMQNELASESKSNGGLGPMKSARGGEIVQFNTDLDTGEIRASSEIKIGYEGTDSENPLSASFQKSKEGWTIGGIPDLFPPPSAGQH
jgi:hypothetical protein